MKTDEVDERVAMTLRTLGSRAETVVRNPRSTVEPPQQVAKGARALEVLQSLSHDSRSLEEQGVLGQGAMGVVRLARQVSLDRLVAVKTLKESSGMDAEALLAEAVLAGSLEHPGILPIYALSLSPTGAPLVVMKRIEGVTWLTALKDDEQRAQYAPGRTRLEAHLRVAMQLCNAVHFAHSRDVIHRDLKPENVMLGRFGEVYLVDWGIATAPGPSNQLAGTPAYMAPEMLGLEGSVLSAATDVYLLGAILYEVATGAPPHACPSAAELFASVMRSTLEFPAHVEAELQAIIRRAMALEPSRRYATALELRGALERFLEHQGARELVAQSQQRVAELESALKAQLPDAVAISRLFTECRFGFGQVLRTWPDNPEARASLEAITATMIGFELRQGATKAARTLLAELSAPAPALVKAVEAAEAADREKAIELERLHRLATTVDPLTGSTTRMWLSIGLGVIWLVSPLFQRAYFGATQTMDETLATVPVALLSLAVMMVVRRITRHRPRGSLNDQIGRFLLYSMVAQVIGLVFIRYALGGLGAHAVVAMLAYWGFIGGTIAATLVAEVWPTSAAFFAALLLALWLPERRYEAIMLANGVLLANMITILKAVRSQLRARQGPPQAG